MPDTMKDRNKLLIDLYNSLPCTPYYFACNIVEFIPDRLKGKYSKSAISKRGFLACIRLD